MTEREIGAYIVAAIREYESMLVKFGAQTRGERAKHAALLAGFKDGLNMAAEIRQRGLNQEPV